MATKYVTGRDLTLTINNINYKYIASGATLTIDSNQQVLETINGRIYKTIDQTATLQVELFQDWGSTSSGTTSNSICEALWSATKTAPDTTIAFTMVVTAGAVTKTYAGNIYPNYPVLGGNATDSLTASVSFVVDGGTVTAS
jgi:hypothetical protein